MTAAERQRRAYYRRELREYEKVTEMTDEERAAVREWVADGNSVHDNPSLCVYEGGMPVDFLDCYRQEEEMRAEYERMTPYEREEHLAQCTGYGAEDILRRSYNEAVSRLEVYGEVLLEHGLLHEAEQAAERKLEDFQRKHAENEQCTGIDSDLPFC